MSERPPATILCLASYHKGEEFLRACKRQGCGVILLTVSVLEHADWPRESIDELFHMPDLSQVEEVIKGVSYLARSRDIGRIVPLDDYDVTIAAALREHLRIPGMGTTTARYFRDKLAMRERAHSCGILVPKFVHVLNYDRLRDYMERVPPPWVLKPRSEVSTIGINRIESPDDLWPRLDALGDRQSFFLLERYISGNVYHVDSIVSEREVVFAEAHGYDRPPLDVFHGGGLAISRTVPRKSEDEQALLAVNRQVVEGLGMVRGVTHAEFIKGHEDGRFYFLEIGARVGGANTVEMIEGSTGINLWREWADIEIGQGERPYSLPPRRQEYGAVILSLARQEYPDMSAYTDREIVYRLNKRHHAGLVLATPDPDRLHQLLQGYRERFEQDFFTSLPPYESRPAET
jgi:hypothetical protein